MNPKKIREILASFPTDSTLVTELTPLLQFSEMLENLRKGEKMVFLVNREGRKVVSLNIAGWVSTSYKEDWAACLPWLLDQSSIDRMIYAETQMEVLKRRTRDYPDPQKWVRDRMPGHIAEREELFRQERDAVYQRYVDLCVALGYEPEPKDE
jgi:hypothetical protein